MPLINTAQKILSQLAFVLVGIEEKEYSKKIKILSDSSIGQHTRHVIEFFNCLLEGYETGEVNYDKRKRDLTIEEDKMMALCYLDIIVAGIKNKDFSKPLTLEADYDLLMPQPIKIQTVFERELVYNIEHAIHHMALMKVGIMIVAPKLKLPEEFGVAASTIRHQQKNVHSHLPS